MTIVAAASMTNGLGIAGGLPWKLKGEMAYFRKATTALSSERQERGYKNAVIMGRKTWASIPPKFRPLKDRVNIVISRSQTAAELGISSDQDTWLFPSLDDATHYIRTRMDASSSSAAADIERIFVIGGAQLYADCIRDASSGLQRPYLVDRLLITRILHPEYPDCDAFFPEIRTASQIQQDLQLRGEATKADGLPLSHFQPLERRQWEKSSADELRSHLAFPDHQTDGVLGGSVVEEAGVLYQYQMWTKTQDV
ncbi:hypothetical protein ACQY0O_008396 [Thecaphora frezii]